MRLSLLKAAYVDANRLSQEIRGVWGTRRSAANLLSHIEGKAYGLGGDDSPGSSQWP